MDHLDFLWICVKNTLIDLLIYHSLFYLQVCSLVLCFLFVASQSQLRLMNLIKRLPSLQQHTNLGDLSRCELKVCEDLVHAQLLRVFVWEVGIISVQHHQHLDRFLLAERFNRHQFGHRFHLWMLLGQSIAKRVCDQNDLDELCLLRQVSQEFEEVILVFLDDLVAMIDEQHQFLPSNQIYYFCLVICPELQALAYC